MNAHKSIFRSFKLQGLSIQTEALNHLIQELSGSKYSSVTVADVIDNVKVKIERKELTSSVVDMQSIRAALESIMNAGNDFSAQTIQVFDAFQVPRILYKTSERMYHILKDEKRTLHSKGHSKLEMFRNRLKIVEQRLKRNPIFSPPLLATDETTYIELVHIDSLLGTSDIKRLLAMLGRDECGNLFLEDLSIRVQIDISSAMAPKGFFTVNSIVLVEGTMKGDIFHVEAIGFPPAESRQQSLLAMNELDPLGLPYSRQDLEQLDELEKASIDTMFVILSDVHLDDHLVMEKLKNLFAGFEEIVPTLFVFIGNFTSYPVSQGSYAIQELKTYFDELCDLILSFPRIAANSNFVFIPGPDDITSAPANVLPRPNLPKVCTSTISSKIPNVTFSSNPCRIRFYSQEIVIFREDLLYRMRRHMIPFNSEEKACKTEPEPDDHDQEDITQHLVTTIIDQGHLCPLPLAVQPIYWDYDASLQLFPLPDVIILADRAEQYQYGYSGTAAFNPVYRPATKESEFSSIK